MLCLCAAQLKFWLQTDLGRENSASCYRQEDSCFWLFSLWSRVGHALRSVFMLWLVKIWQVSSCAKFMQYLESCLLWQLKLTEFWVDLWCFNCLFPLDVQNEIQLLSGVFCYSWLVCLLGFWLRNTSLVKVGNPISDGVVFVFTLLDPYEDCKVWSDTGFTWYLSGAASRMVSQRNYCIWCLFFVCNLMKSRVVYAGI